MSYLKCALQPVSTCFHTHDLRPPSHTCPSLEIGLGNQLIIWDGSQDNLINGEHELLGGLWNLRKMVLPLPSQGCDLPPEAPWATHRQNGAVTPNFRGVREGIWDTCGIIKLILKCSTHVLWPCLFLLAWRHALFSKWVNRAGTKMHLRRAVSALLFFF